MILIYLVSININIFNFFLKDDKKYKNFKIATKFSKNIKETNEKETRNEKYGKIKYKTF